MKKMFQHNKLPTTPNSASSTSTVRDDDSATIIATPLHSSSKYSTPGTPSVVSSASSTPATTTPQQKRFFHHFTSIMGSHSNSKSALAQQLNSNTCSDFQGLPTASSTINHQQTTTIGNGSNTVQSSIAMYFDSIAQLNFSQSSLIIKQYQQVKNHLQHNHKQQGNMMRYKQSEDEVIQSLKRFIQCETLYYDANYSPNEKQDLHSLYSLLSSNLSLISMNAPYEHNGAQNYQNEIMMMMESNSPSLTSNMDYIIYITSSDSASLNNNQALLVDKEFILSKQIIKDFRVLIQLRLEIIAFYRILSRYKHPPKYDNYVRIINSLKSKYINRITHPFFEKIVQSINMELSTLNALFECEYNICSYKYKESVFTLWKVKHLFNQWNQLFYKWEQGQCTSDQSSPTLKQQTGETKLSRSFSEDNFLHHMTTTNTTAANTSNTNTAPSVTPPTTAGSSNVLTYNNSSSKEENFLNKTNLFKWMTMIFGFSQSKFTFIFHDIITNQSNMIKTHAQLSDQSLIPGSLAVDYIQWIKSFNDIVFTSNSRSFGYFTNNGIGRRKGLPHEIEK